MEPNPLAILALCFLGAGGLIFLLWLNHQWVTRGRRKSEAPAQARAGALEIVLSYILGGAGPVNDYGDEQGVDVGDRPSSPSGSQWVEPQKIIDTYQAEPIDPLVREPPSDPLIISHKMGRKELTILLAAQKDEDGGYRFSANKIADFVGGTGAEVKGWVADVRGRKEPAARSLQRPANGWGKAS